ncbi:MAG: PorP/SprF family type IX secretion system membrane protein [Flavobacteriales bacterium]
MLKRITPLVFILLLSRPAFSQDIHFSQYNQFVQLYNPAMVGQFDNMMKGTIVHRKQWGRVGEGYRTNGFDAQYKLLSLYNDNFLGFGLMVYQDDAGKADMKTFAVKGSVSYNIEAGSNDFIAAGAQFGYEQRSINFDGLAWDSQYNGVNYDPTMDDRERFIASKRNFVDIGAGVHWRHKSDKRKYTIGYSVFHANQQITMVARGNDRMRLRHAMIGSMTKRYRHVDIRTDALVQRQSGAMEVVVGVTCDYRFGEESRYTDIRTSSVARGGIFFRNGDSFVPYIGFDYKRFMGASLGYDIRVAKMNTAKRPGAFELTLTYFGLPNQKRMKLHK